MCLTERQSVLARPPAQPCQAPKPLADACFLLHCPDAPGPRKHPPGPRKHPTGPGSWRLAKLVLDEPDGDSAQEEVMSATGLWGHTHSGGGSRGASAPPGHCNNLTGTPFVGALGASSVLLFMLGNPAQRARRGRGQALRSVCLCV